jgi:NADH-quinone oxidoreductase subunit J
LRNADLIQQKSKPCGGDRKKVSAQQIVFYLLSAFILGAGLLSVSTRKIFRSAIWLLFSLIGVAGLYFWMEMEFIAAVQIVIYVGGIVVLIIFSIFLTQQSGKEMPRPPVGRIIAGLLAAVFGLGFSWHLISNHPFSAASATFNYEVSAIGKSMLSTGREGFVLPFEVVSILLLAAMIGCIVIAMRAKPVAGLKSEISHAGWPTGRPETEEGTSVSSVQSPTSNPR